MVRWYAAHGSRQNRHPGYSSEDTASVHMSGRWSMVEVQKTKDPYFYSWNLLEQLHIIHRLKLSLSILNCALVQNPQFIHCLKQISFSSSSFKTTFFWLTAAHKQKVWISGGWGFHVHTQSCVPEMLSVTSYKTENRRKLRMRCYRVSSTVNTLTSLF